MKANDLARVLRAAAAECEAIAAEAGAERVDWVDQHRSPLGPRRHCAAVRRLLRENDGRAAIVGRRMLLSNQAIAAELSRLGKAEPRSPSVADELRAELGLPTTKK